MADIGLDEVADTSLRVRLLGPFQLFAGVSASALRLPAGKATTIAELLAVRRGRLVSVDTIIEVLWGDDPPPAAAQNVASLVSRLRRVLGPERITGGRGGYRLEPGGCVVDIDVAEQLTREAEAQLRAGRPALAASAAVQARALLEGGDFLEDEPFAPGRRKGGAKRNGSSGRRGERPGARRSPSASMPPHSMPRPGPFKRTRWTRRPTERGALPRRPGVRPDPRGRSLQLPRQRLGLHAPGVRLPQSTCALTVRATGLQPPAVQRSRPPRKEQTTWQRFSDTTT
jgi:DNA-binding winged helix-turn-helix (wHTH) protein